MRRTDQIKIATIACACAGFLVNPPVLADTQKQPQDLEILSKVFHVDRVYRSMEGPYDIKQFTLDQNGEQELVWITGMRSEIVDAEGDKTMPSEYMCHVNLDMFPKRHRETLGLNKVLNPRLMTLSQGQFDIELPPGFGIPMLTDEPLTLTTQVLNHNTKDADLRLRHKITIQYVRDRDLTGPLKPLYVNAPFGMKLLKGKGGYYGLQAADPAIHGPGCLPGQHAENGTSTGVFNDQLGRTFSGHWKVEPGQEINRTPVTGLMTLPQDTTIHYIAIHLHPFAEYVELNDLTTGKTLFRSRATGTRHGIGLAHVETFSSDEGIPVYRDHHYELVSVYNNTSGKDQDAMATMFLYMLDKDFNRKKITALQDP